MSDQQTTAPDEPTGPPVVKSVTRVGVFRALAEPATDEAIAALVGTHATVHALNQELEGTIVGAERTEVTEDRPEPGVWLTLEVER